jgi:hypothetical protein
LNLFERFKKFPVHTINIFLYFHLQESVWRLLFVPLRVLPAKTTMLLLASGSVLLDCVEGCVCWMPTFHVDLCFYILLSNGTLNKLLNVTDWTLGNVSMYREKIPYLINHKQDYSHWNIQQFIRQCFSLISVLTIPKYKTTIPLQCLFHLLTIRDDIVSGHSYNGLRHVRKKNLRQCYETHFFLQRIWGIRKRHINQ